MKKSKQEEVARLKQILVRIRFDLLRKHPFPTAPHLPLVESVSVESLSRATEKLVNKAKSCEKRSMDIKAQIDEATNKPKACGKLGLWESLAMEYCETDKTSWTVWRDGLDGIGTCR